MLKNPPCICLRSRVPLQPGGECPAVSENNVIVADEAEAEAGTAANGGVDGNVAEAPNEVWAVQVDIEF